MSDRSALAVFERADFFFRAAARKPKGSRLKSCYIFIATAYTIISVAVLELVRRKQHKKKVMG